MADVDPGDILRVGAGMTFDTDYDIVNVWHLLADNAAGTTWATCVSAVVAYMEVIYNGLEVQLNDHIDSSSITIANVTQATTIGSVAWGTPWQGDESGEPTAAGVCCFTWGRTYTPRVQIRKYFGVFGEVGMVDAAWSGTVRAACEAAMTYHIAPHLIAGGWTFTGVAYNRTLATYVEAVSVESSPEPSYQRRRRRGRGS